MQTYAISNWNIYSGKLLAQFLSAIVLGTFQFRGRVLSKISGFHPFERPDVVVELVEQIRRVEELVGDADGQKPML